MAISYPGSLDAWTNPTAADTLATTPHSTHHGNHYDAIEALEAQPGVTNQCALQGFKAWTCDSAMASGTVQPASGTLYMARIVFPAPCTVTNLHLYATTAGAGVTNFWMALYDSSLALLKQSQAIAWGGAGERKVVLSSTQAVGATAYYIGFWFNIATTTPFLSRGSAGSTSPVNSNVTGNTSRFATSSTGLTTTAPNPAAALSASDGHSFWFAAS